MNKDKAKPLWQYPFKHIPSFLFISLLLLFSLACTVHDTVPSTDETSQTVPAQATPTPQPEESEPVPDGLPDASPEHLPRWRGFNLMNKYNQDWSDFPFRESDFRQIAEFGFNFVRLPMDYRLWTGPGGWDDYLEPVLEEIDQAVAWGREYNIHVQINFHRAPGYCVNPPAEELNLWQDREVQEAFINQWVMFARRYEGIPARNLSFNLVNEPPDISSQVYADLVRRTAAAIHAVDPQRLVIADGINYAHDPVWELVDDPIAQSFHQYQPFGVTHYQASWVSQADQWPVPQWPTPLIPDKLYGDQKPEFQRPMQLIGPFSQDTALKIRVQIVSDYARLQIRADDEVVFEQLIRSGPGEGDWKETVYRQEWDIYQNIFDRDYEALIPAGSEVVTIQMIQGDWLSFSRLQLSDPAGLNLSIEPTVMDWGVLSSDLQISPDGQYSLVTEQAYLDQAWIEQTIIASWLELKNRGVGVMVGEWGVYNKTPHDVTLQWMEDNLQLFAAADIGWALWEYRGAFGIVNSYRDDVQYAPYRGSWLDQEMLDLLLEH